MSGKTTNLILLGILLGVILGGLLGFYASDFMLAISIIGTLFFNALTLLVLPLVIAALVVGVTALGDYRKLARLGSKTLWYFSLVGVIAVVIGIAATLVNFGGIFNFDMTASSELIVDSPYLNYSQLMGGASRFNFLLSNGQYLVFVILAVLFGGVLTVLGARNHKNIRDFFREANEGLLKLFSFLLYLAPVGLFSIVGTATALQKDNLSTWFASLGMYLLIVLFAFLVMGVIVLPLFLKISGHQSPGRFLVGMFPALLTALGTGSSTATLPITYEGVVTRNNIDQKAASLVLPLGTVFNIGATAMWLVMSIAFLSQGIEGGGLSILQVIVVAILSLLVSIGLAGAPMVGLALTVVIVAAGLPPYLFLGMAAITVGSLFVDRLRAVLNVWGDAVGAAVISESLEFKAVGRVKKTTSRDMRGGDTRRGRPDSGPDRRKTDSRRRGRGDIRRRDSRGSGSRPDSRPETPVRKETPVGQAQGGQFQRSEKRSPFDIKASSTPDFDAEPSTDRPRREYSGSKQEYRKPAPPSRERFPESRGPERKSPPRTEPDRETLKKEKKDEARVDILDNEVFKKELARVSAHLHSIDKKFEGKPPESTVESKAETEKEIPDTRSENEEPETGVTPHIDFLKSTERDEVPEAAFEAPTSITEQPEETPEPEEPVAMEYGRSRYRRPDKSAGSDFPAPQPVSEEDAPKAEDSFSNENISFGRTKKKKTR
jgi:Na+/H+-dicarboxylate symporter